jgi:hypothetical protein
LAYYDPASGQSVLIAEPKDTIGVLVASNRVVWEDALTDVRADVRVTYVLMPDHYHLLLETPQAKLVVGIKWFQGTYTQRFNSRHRLRARAFGARAVQSGLGGGRERLFFGGQHLHPPQSGASAVGEGALGAEVAQLPVEQFSGVWGGGASAVAGGGAGPVRDWCGKRWRGWEAAP